MRQFSSSFKRAIGLVVVVALAVVMVGPRAHAQDPSGDSVAAAAAAAALAAVSTAIPYQGQLNTNGTPANGTHDFQFKLFDAASAGVQVGSTLVKEDVSVANGLFATELGFGATPFTGQARWLEISVRAGSSTGAFTTLTPRRPLLAVPYALYSLSGPKAFDGQVTIQSPVANQGLVVKANGKSTSVLLHVAEGDYGFLNLGGGTQLRGNGRQSVFDGQVAIQSPVANQGLVVKANGKSTSVLLHVAEGDYGYLDLGGDTQLRGNGRQSVFSGQVAVRTLEIRGGADVAEPFTISGEGTIEPGMVVAIDPDNPGQLRLAGAAYDRTVAGVVSGAGGINPGLILQQEGSVAAGEHPVSLSGRVYVYADAASGAIEPGDLLTTSDNPGHAMKVTDHDRAQGAILGKAMSRLAEGTGLVLVLVTLQ